MNITNLSISALPPISVPFRYFVVAPLFLLAAALLILFYGEALWLSRWHPATLAVTHAFTLGFIATVMMGALYQFLPVIGGVGIKQVKWVAPIAHTLHVIGTSALIINFVYPVLIVQLSAITALGLGFTLYIGAITSVLLKKLSQGDTIIAIRLAIIALLFVVVLGLLLNAQTLIFETFNISLFDFDKQASDNHALMGGFGWAGLLIIAVSLQVVPMFHVTPSFPNIISKYLPVTIFLLLCALFLFAGSRPVAHVIIAAILLLNGCYAITLLVLFSKRKRKVTDTSVQFWQFASISLLLLSLLFFLPESFYPSVFYGKRVILFTAVFIYFYLVSIIEAMLLKILPFLSYTHLQQRCLSNFAAMAQLPHMHSLLKKQHGQYLLALHLFSSVALVLVIADAQFYYLFGLCLLIEFSWLLMLILTTSLRYHQALKKMTEIG